MNHNQEVKGTNQSKNLRHSLSAILMLLLLLAGCFPSQNTRTKPLANVSSAFCVTSGDCGFYFEDGACCAQVAVGPYSYPHEIQEARDLWRAANCHFNVSINAHVLDVLFNEFPACVTNALNANHDPNSCASEYASQIPPDSELPCALRVRKRLGSPPIKWECRDNTCVPSNLSTPTKYYWEDYTVRCIHYKDFESCYPVYSSAAIAYSHQCCTNESTIDDCGREMYDAACGEIDQRSEVKWAYFLVIRELCDPRVFNNQDLMSFVVQEKLAAQFPEVNWTNPCDAALRGPI